MASIFLVVTIPKCLTGALNIVVELGTSMPVIASWNPAKMEVASAVVRSLVLSPVGVKSMTDYEIR